MDPDPKIQKYPDPILIRNTGRKYRLVPSWVKYPRKLKAMRSEFPGDTPHMDYRTGHCNNISYFPPGSYLSHTAGGNGNNHFLHFYVGAVSTIGYQDIFLNSRRRRRM